MGATNSALSLAQGCLQPVDDGAEEEVLAKSQFLSPRASKLSSSSLQHFGSTMIIFDWDDTLLCSSVVRCGESFCAERLEELEVAVELILRTAMTLGETLIVTNGNGTWVHDSARRFMPGLLPLLSEITVVSARALYEGKYPNDPFMWKQAAFEHLLIEERSYSFDSGVNLVALGDQFPEIDAARHVCSLIGGSSKVKTVKFQEAPSINELLGQIYRAEEVLGRIVKEQENQSYDLVQRRLPSDAAGHVVRRASAWTCSLEEDQAQTKGDPMKGIKDMWGLLI